MSGRVDEKPPAVQVVGRDRRDIVASSLARAFADDPAMRFIFPDATLRGRRLPRFFRMIFDGDAAHGVRIASIDGAAATLWRAPGHAHSSPAELLKEAVPLLTTFGLALGRALRVSAAIDAHLPRFPFWYLHIAGCDPDRQGEGLGKLLVQSGIDRFAGSGLPLYLETANERNIGFYQSLGFAVTGDWHVPGGGPQFWSMLRPA